MWGQQREVFPGLDSGPNDSEGHYSMPWKNVPLLTPHILLAGIRWNLWSKLDDLGFADDIAFILSTRGQ